MNKRKQNNNSITSLLPQDTIISILRYACVKDIVKVSATCTMFRDCADEWIPFVLNQCFSYNKKRVFEFLIRMIGSKKSLFAQVNYVDLVSWTMQTGRFRSIDSKDVDGYTLLAYACTVGNHRAVDALLIAGANPNTISDHNGGMPPLYIAVLGNHKNVVISLLEAGAHVNWSQSRNESLTPLYLAAASGYVNIVDALLKGDAIVNCDSEHEPSPLYIAMLQGHKQIVRRLVIHGANINKNSPANGGTPYQIAKKQGYTDIVVLMNVCQVLQFLHRHRTIQICVVLSLVHIIAASPLPEIVINTILTLMVLLKLIHVWYEYF